MKTTAKFTAAIIFVLAVIFVSGCVDNSAGTQTDPRADKFLLRFVDSHPLVLKSGAWIGVDIENNMDGFVFLKDYTYKYIVREYGNWVVVSEGAWSEGEINFQGAIWRYEIDADILTLEHDTLEPMIFMKNVNIQIVNP